MCVSRCVHAVVAKCPVVDATLAYLAKLNIHHKNLPVSAVSSGALHLPNSTRRT